MFLKVFFVMLKLIVLLLIANAHHVEIHCVIASCKCSLCCYWLLVFFCFKFLVFITLGLVLVDKQLKYMFLVLIMLLRMFIVLLVIDHVVTSAHHVTLPLCG